MLWTHTTYSIYSINTSDMLYFDRNAFSKGGEQDESSWLIGTYDAF